LKLTLLIKEKIEGTNVTLF